MIAKSFILFLNKSEGRDPSTHYAYSCQLPDLICQSYRFRDGIECTEYQSLAVSPTHHPIMYPQIPVPRAESINRNVYQSTSEISEGAGKESEA
jgi:hypothetical protein